MYKQVVWTLWVCMVLGVPATPGLGATSTPESRYGFSEPSREITIAAPEAGIIESLAVKEGDVVAQGAVLAVLDSAVMRANLAIAKARASTTGRIEALSTECDIRKIRCCKLIELKESGAARPEELERAMADLAIAEANLTQAEESRGIDRLEVKQIEAQLERRILRSPIAGVVTQIGKDVGENVTPAAADVMTVAQLNPLRVICYLSLSQAAALTIGDKLGVVFEQSEALVLGLVEFISPVVDAESGTVRTKILISNASGKLRSGLRCRVRVPE